MEREQPQIGDLIYFLNDTSIITFGGTYLLEAKIPLLIISCDDYETENFSRKILMWCVEALMPNGKLAKIIIRDGLTTNEYPKKNNNKFDMFDIFLIQRF